MKTSNDKSETPSNPNHINGFKIDVPSSIASLHGTTLAEQIVLSRIVCNPRTTNESLAKLLGFSVRGVESMLKRLRDHGFLSIVGAGRARRFIPKFPVEQHTKCTEKKIFGSHTKAVVQNSISRLPLRESPHPPRVHCASL